MWIAYILFLKKWYGGAPLSNKLLIKLIMLKEKNLNGNWFDFILPKNKKNTNMNQQM